MTFTILEPFCRVLTDQAVEFVVVVEFVEFVEVVEFVVVVTFITHSQVRFALESFT